MRLFPTAVHRVSNSSDGMVSAEHGCVLAQSLPGGHGGEGGNGTSATVLVTIGSTVVGRLSITATATARIATHGIHFRILSRRAGESLILDAWSDGFRPALEPSKVTPATNLEANGVYHKI